MALRTVGTFAQTTLLGQFFFNSAGGMTDGDLALLNQPIASDGASPGDGLLATYLGRQGQLWVPRRGWLTVLPGDMVAVDAATGWPILLSAKAAGGAGWVHT